MIKNLYSNTPHVKINVSPPYVSGNPGQIGVGNVRYNSNTQMLETYDGYTWMQISTTAEVDLTPETIKVLEWAKQEMSKQENLNNLAQIHPTIASLKFQRDAVDEKLAVVLELLK